MSQQTLQQASGDDNASVPTAPYPPFRYPTNNPALRSSLSSSPHYASTSAYVTRNAAGGSSDGGGIGSDKSGVNSLHASARGVGGTGGGGESSDPDDAILTSRLASPATELLPKAVRETPLYSSQIKLWPSAVVSDTLACINCLSPTLARQRNSGSSRKMGPVLLELRKLEPNTGFDDEDFFNIETVGVSRGNPSLGTSVASTCLDLPTGLIFNNNTANSNTGGSFNSNNYDGGGAFTAATGLTTGALCIHTFDGVSRDEMGLLSSSIEYYHTPRHHRQASAVAWRPATNTNHVAIGLLGSSSGAGPQQAGAGNRRGNPVVRTSGDREFCCFLWDVEAQSSTMAKRMATPMSKLCHNAPVASLAWLDDGQTLATGGQWRNIQLYDMRVSGTNAPPISAYAHNFGVHGIEVDPHRSNLMATFCRSVGEPVKLWDVRRMDSVVSEIKPKPPSNDNSDTPVVSSIKWSNLEPGTLSIAIGTSVQDYETSSGSRPVLCRVSHVKKGQQIVDIALYDGHSSSELGAGSVGTGESMSHSTRLISGLYSRRMLAVLEDRTVRDMAKHTNAPLAISRRDGRLAHALGPTLWVGPTNEGPAAMEGLRMTHDEDISATMMRRSRCHDVARYSMDTSSNIRMLSEERPIGTPSPLEHSPSSTRYSLLRLWSWIDRVEALCNDGEEPDEEFGWPARGVMDAGVLHLLGASGPGVNDQPLFSDSLSIDMFNSPARRSALTACGWAGKFDLINVLGDCEALGEYERSAAVAVWHGDIGAAVETLQRASDGIRLRLGEQQDDTIIPSLSLVTAQYAETLDLIAMCIAGYGGTSTSSSRVWRSACTSLLRRDDLSSERGKSSSRIAYLRGLCHFLMSIGLSDGMDHVLGNDQLSLCDRVAFACRFLAPSDLLAYLTKCIKRCRDCGDIEGLVITGLSKEGIAIVQAFVDRYADVQTAALVVSRAILPSDWTNERRVCTEWVEAYRGLLNTWQMWQSRAMFDVDRAELLRRIKVKSTLDVLPGAGSKSRRLPLPGRRQSSRVADPDVLASVPAQLDARCNYCSSPLGLRRNEMNSNQWLSKMKPVLSCCPQCRKPLPRCSICLLTLGCLNPYMELTRDRSRPGPRGASSPMQSTDDLSSLANLPFAEWFTWCMRCNHGGHAHHLVGWFSNHQEVCPVSGCDCKCQFDGVIKLSRPALCKPAIGEYI